MCYEAIDTNCCPACKVETRESELMLCAKVKYTETQTPCKTLARPVKRHLTMLIEQCPNFGDEAHNKHIKEKYKKGVPKEIAKAMAEKEASKSKGKEPAVDEAFTNRYLVLTEAPKSEFAEYDRYLLGPEILPHRAKKRGDSTGK